MTEVPALPTSVPWHGTTVYKLPAGTGGMPIGVGPDGTLHLVTARSSDLRVSVDAISRNGAHKAGWPSGGVPLSGYPYGWAVDSEGVVYVASAAMTGLTASPQPSPLTITAIGSNGKVVAGWPFRSAAAMHEISVDVMVGPDGRVCVMDEKPGPAVQSSSKIPMVIYCLGRDGKLLPGWPYVSEQPLWHPAMGPDGTVYVDQVTPTEGVSNWPDVVLALGLDGKPKPGWTPWSPEGYPPIEAVVPAADGRVWVMLRASREGPNLALLGSDGHLTADRLGAFTSTSTFTGMPAATARGMVLALDGTLYVSTYDGGGGDVNDRFVTAFLPDGSVKPGWPVRVGGAAYLNPAPDGSLWAIWEKYAGSSSERTFDLVAFDSTGNLRAGFPMDSPQVWPVFDSSGDAFVGSVNAGISEISVLTR
jgi:hypothetical protein